MIINYFEYSNTGYYQGECETLHASHLEKLSPKTLEVWYWYRNSGYEGSGWLVARQKNSWEVYSLGHCSCNGPLEYPANTYESLSVLMASCYYDKDEEWGVEMHKALKGSNGCK